MGWVWAGIGFLRGFNRTQKFLWGGFLLGRVPPVGWAAFPAGKGITEQGLGVFRGLAGWRREAGTGGGGGESVAAWWVGLSSGVLEWAGHPVCVWAGP
jgi:hypothetical protein